MTIPPLNQRAMLVVEGKDEQLVFGEILKKNSISGIDIRDVGGKTRIRQSLQALVLDPGFGNVKRIGVIRDADEDPHSAFESVVDALKAARLPYPTSAGRFVGRDIKVGIFVVPSMRSKGALETLCINSVGSDPRIMCVSEFLKCGEERRPGHSVHSETIASRDKAKAQAFLALLADPDSRTGIAAVRGNWNLDHRAFLPVVTFLKRLASVS